MTKKSLTNIINVSLAAAGLLAFQLAFAQPSVDKSARYDFGDAPDPAYPSRLSSNGARHTDVTKAWFGSAVDVETDARVADLDAGDDGLVNTSQVAFSVTTSVRPPAPWYVRIFRAKLQKFNVNILIDRNNNGVWETPSEWVVRNQRVAVPDGGTVRVEAVGIDGKSVSWDRAHEGWLRMTLTQEKLQKYDGTSRAPYHFGETEDYAPVGESDTPEEGFDVWCFTKDYSCWILSEEEAAAEKKKGTAMKGPYATVKACRADCKEPTIETPTLRRKLPPQKPPEEKTIETESPTPKPPYIETKSPATEHKQCGITDDIHRCFEGHLQYRNPNYGVYEGQNEWNDAPSTVSYTADGKYAIFCEAQPPYDAPPVLCKSPVAGY